MRRTSNEDTVLVRGDLGLYVVADGAGWSRTFFQDHLATLPQAEMLLDWYHLAQKCREIAARICP